MTEELKNKKLSDLSYTIKLKEVELEKYKKLESMGKKFLEALFKDEIAKDILSNFSLNPAHCETGIIVYLFQNTEVYFIKLEDNFYILDNRDDVDKNKRFYLKTKNPKELIEKIKELYLEEYLN